MRVTFKNCCLVESLLFLAVKPEMGKRYYCDYCDRSFPDTADNRKKHVSGALHHKQKKLHYNNFRDSATILAEERDKRPCRMFIQTGSCSFGSTCRFSHMNPDKVYSLQQQVIEENFVKRRRATVVPVVDDCILNTWLEKVSETTNSRDTSDTNEIALSIESWKLPAKLEFTTDLPPSLIPPTFSEIVQFGSDLEWG